MRAEHGAIEGGDDDRRGVVFGLLEQRQPLLAQPVQLARIKGRAERDVRHQRQRVRQPRDRHVQPDGRRVEAAAGRQLGAEKVDGVGERQRIARAGALIEHRRREAREPFLSGGIRRASGADDEIDLRDGHFVQLDDPDRQAVRELALLHGRQHQRRRGPRLRRRGAIRDLGAGRPGRDRRAEDESRERGHGGVAPFEWTISSTRPAAGRKARIAACTSSGASAR
jgi:hypothetical protein